MSEQTPDASNGISESAEPSMEDILASIRKIIADDEDNGGVIDLPPEPKSEPNVLDSVVDSQPDDLAVAVDNVAVSHADAVDNVGETLDLDIISEVADVEPANVEPSESEIDALIADMDMIDTKDKTVAVADEVLELESIDMEPEANAELEIPALVETQEAADAADDDLNSLEDLVLSEVEPVEAETLEAVEEMSVGETSDDELSSLLDDMTSDDNDADDALAVIEDEVENSEAENLELVVDPAEDLLDDDVDAEEDLMDDTVSSDSDMALVKSLLADLTGEPLHEDATLDANVDINEDIEDAADIDEDIAADLQDVEEGIVEAATIDIDDIEAETDDVMDEILSLTLDDEVELQAEAVAASGVEAPLSLQDIAEQAEADANAMSGGKAIAGIAALGAGAKLMQTEETSEDLEDLELLLELEQDVETEDELEPDFVDDILSKIDDTAEIETELETLTDLTPDEETTPMPRAAKKDAIIDEVTESATADVFSSLNKVVEEKAVVAERGDRIGDLVQEALRPMLKEWLDANLKSIVERAVTKEVKRISSGK